MDVFPRLRDTLTRGFLIEKRLLTPSPDKSAGQAPTRVGVKSQRTLSSDSGPDSGRGRSG